MEVRGRPLHFGVQLQAQETTWQDYVAALRSVEALGFDSAWSFDHMLPFCGPDDGACFETLTTLGAMAALTERVRIGVLVSGVLYRDPATLARSAALVDHISAGRLEFSLGAAWAEREFRAYGLAFPPLNERYERLGESLQIVKSLWSQKRTTFLGRYYRIENAPCEPKPLQNPSPPITIGGSGLGTLRLAAEHATRWNMQGSPDQFAERAELLRQCCEKVGRDFGEIELSVHPPLALARTHEEAEALAMQSAARYGQDLEAERGSWLVGTPVEVADQIRRYTEVGVSHWVIALAQPFDIVQLKMLREEVLPLLG
ncbi:MAG: TIGR03560 family F420-dependent LLM class oxidoreductase [Acidimicrobiales bacterium]|jgi:F420-dependent oxidoreductase-like protein